MTAWITIGRSSPFADRAATFNSPAYRAMGSPHRVTMLWDAASRLLIVTPGDRGLKVSSRRQISIRGFLNETGLILEPGRYRVELLQGCKIAICVT